LHPYRHQDCNTTAVACRRPQGCRREEAVFQGVSPLHGPATGGAIDLVQGVKEVGFLKEDDISNNRIAGEGVPTIRVVGDDT
jgi:hypothetical protein